MEGMDLKISERCCGGDCFAPFCTMDAYQNQQQDAQAIPPSYPTCTCVPLFNTIVSDQSYLTNQAAHTTQDTSYTSDYRVRFPAIEAPQWCEVSRHKAVEEWLMSSFQPTSESSQEIYEKGWEMEVNSHKSERKRCILTKDQLIGLEREFEGTHYVVGRDRFNLAAKLGLSEQQVKVWFQNRRNKWRRISKRLSHEKQRK